MFSRWTALKVRLLYRKYHFLENSKNLILIKKIFLAKQKNTCLFIVDKEPKKNYLVQICDIDCQSNMEWPIYIISSHSSRVFLNTFYRIDINKENELTKMMLQFCRIACSQHGCIFLSPMFDWYTSRRYRCARAQLSKFPSWPQFSIQTSQNIFKNCLKACWTTFSLKVLSTLNFLAYFFPLKLKHENSASRNCYNKNY